METANEELQSSTEEMTQPTKNCKVQMKNFNQLNEELHTVSVSISLK